MTVSLLIIKIKQTVSVSDPLEDLYAEQTRYISNSRGIPAASKIEFWSIKIIKLPSQDHSIHEWQIWNYELSCCVLLTQHISIQSIMFLLLMGSLFFRVLYWEIGCITNIIILNKYTNSCLLRLFVFFPLLSPAPTSHHISILQERAVDKTHSPEERTPTLYSNSQLSVQGSLLLSRFNLSFEIDQVHIWQAKD